MQIKKSDILIILPAYNEGSMIEEVISKIREGGYQNICVVNDGSSDDTFQKALNSGATVLTHIKNRGAGAAVQTGIAFARKSVYKYVILMDSDGQHFPLDINDLCRKMESSSADLVIGNRFASKQNEIPTHRRFYNTLANIYTNLFCNNNYLDTQSGFRLLNRKAIDCINLKSSDFGFCSEMLIAAERHKLHVEETPVRVVYTDYSLGKGQSLFIGFKTARSIFWRIVFE